MLFCLVALPVWAISGKSLPELTDTVLARIRLYTTGPDPETFVNTVADGMLADGAPTWAEPTGAEIPTASRVPGPVELQVSAPDPVHRASSAAPAAPTGSRKSDQPRPVAKDGAIARDGRQPPTGDSDPELTAMQLRLRTLGATQYTLEKWGEGSPLFRFQCDVAIAENPDHCRHFEATERSPQHAMTAVLQQVESWRGEIRR
jgi:hypothetical protein